MAVHKRPSSDTSSRRLTSKTPNITLRSTRATNLSGPSNSIIPTTTGLIPLNSTTRNGSQSEEPTIDGSVKKPKRTRGHNRGEAARRVVGQEQKKLEVKFREGDIRILGENANKFATEIGIIIKHHAPLQRSGWSKIESAEKDVLYARLKDIFEMDFAAELYYKVICDTYFSKQYKDYRSKCRVLYDGIVKSGKNPLQNRPSLVVKDDDWRWMCTECFSNPEWQKKSKQAAKNREKLKTPHVAGSKSYVRHFEEQTVTERNDGAGRIEMYKKTHWTSKRGWTSNEAKANYEEMKRLRDEQSTQHEGESSNRKNIDEATICMQVLGEAKYGHKLGFGPVPRKKDLVELAINSREAGYVKQQEDLSKKVEVLEKMQQDQAEVIKRLVAVLDTPVEHPSFGLNPPRSPLPSPLPPPSSGLVA